MLEAQSVLDEQRHALMRKELNILIVEDVEQDAALILDELRSGRVPFKARRVDNPRAFLAELEASLPDIVLSDFTLPDFDALAALGLLRQRHPEVPFILVTGTRSEEVAVECIRQGADDYLLKASLKRLPSSIVSAIDKKAAEKARARAEAALRRSEEQYRLIAANTRDLISLLDTEGRFLYASPAFEAVLGLKAGALEGKDSLDLAHPDDRERLRGAWREALLHKEGRTVEVRLQTAGGDWLDFESVCNWIFDETGQAQRTVVVSRDITRRKQAEEAQRQLPRLVREAQEAERRRVARDLHDSVNQILASVKFRLESLTERLAASDPAAGGDAGKAKLHLERAMQEVRRISRNLRPSELDDLGLVPAVRSLCREFGERTNVTVDLAVSRLPQSMPNEVELHLYRMIQEALNNIEKHSRATRVELELQHRRARLKASIRDNGRGFDPAATHPRRRQRPGMGLADMRERAAFVGGTCSLRSSPDAGTEILIEMPLKPALANPAQPR
jgi:PAS domain S-box-containing protein